MTEFKKEEPGGRLRISFICTDRGQHRSVELGYSLGGAVVHSRGTAGRNTSINSPWSPDGDWIGFRDPGRYAAKKAHGGYRLVQFVTTWGDPMRPVGTEFCCPKCPRNPQKSREWMETFMAGIRAAGITEVDISRYMD